MKPHRLLVPEYIWEQTLDIFKPFSRSGLEAGCIWYGRRGDEFNLVSMIGVPKQENNPRNFHIDADSLAELNETIGETGLTVVAQVHIHPGISVEHSPYDDKMIVSLRIHSLVIPHYGKRPCDISNVGVHVFCDGRWVLLDSAKGVETVRIIPGVVDMR